MRGFFGIGIYQYLHSENLGSLLRSAVAFNADYLFTIGRKYKKESSDTGDATRQLPCFNYSSYEAFKVSLPKNARLVCIEISENAQNLKTFVHPEQAVYLLGSEGNGIPDRILQDKGNIIVTIPTNHCINVAMAGTCVIWDRILKAKA